MWDEYLWIVVVAGLLAFVVAYGIGANDVANAFATSVGSRAITMRQALCIAAVFEFVGAVALGSQVTKTISGGIASATTFTNDPDVFMYGMFCAMVAAGLWILLATYWALPVSTTHSIIGGVFGFALVYAGNDAIIWAEKIDEFPYYKGLGVIVIGWVVAPTLCALVASVSFIALRASVLRHENSVKRAIYSLPILVMVAVFINLYFVLYKGVTSVHVFTRSEASWMAGVGGAAAGLITACFVPYMMKQQEAGKLKNMVLAPPTEALDTEKGAANDVAEGGWWARNKKTLLHSVDYDIHQATVTDERVKELHASAEQFNGEAEGLYSYAQVFTACCVSFAHGANDVANAAGPFAAIYQVYRLSKVSSKADAPRWILLLSAFGIVVGLGTYGYKVMASLGVHSIKITPSRGFLIELTTALVVTVGSGFGLPLSTTHCQVGGTWGVGATEGRGRVGVNLPLAIKFFAGWIGTLVVAATLSAALFAFGVYSPTLQSPYVPPVKKP